ncbi:MAG: S8 family serine peptidase [Hamadaea sp.]|nr:S8 family serine peptidase [Hamadaea sp.]
MIVAMTVALLPGQAHAAATAEGKAPVSAELQAALASGDSQFLVYLSDAADLSAAKSLPSGQRADRVVTDLQATAERSQQPVRAVLDDAKATYKPFWIANVVWVDGASQPDGGRLLVEKLSGIAGVKQIDLSGTRPLHEPQAGTAEATVDAVEWGLANIRAPQVWSAYGDRGEGIVVANVDSGVQYDHPALVGKYRGNTGSGFSHAYNWFDATGVCPAGTPCDNNDHGTHTMGTMVGGAGADQIGVAPNAKWIAAKACATNNCADPALLAAGQWILAPTDLSGANPRPDLRPDIVNNSWGGDPNDLWYAATVDAWTAAGIFPMFSNGNSGPACATAGSPGDYAQSYSTGAYNISNDIASFSSRGASKVDGAVKPDISAPGVNVRSSVPGGGYAAFSGTSMAAPHVSGTVALMWSAAPALRGDVAATRALLDQTAIDVNNTTCGGTAANNNVFGEGRLDAYQAVTLAPRGPAGFVSGLVRDSATGTPIAAATVVAGDRSTTSAADGSYTLNLVPGEHAVTASAFGYHDATVSVTVTDGATTTQNLDLVPAPMVTLSGRITDGSGHGWPVYASVAVPGRAPVYTDPFTGRYAVTVPGNQTHALTVTGQIPGYQVTTATVVVGGVDKTANVALKVAGACTAPGYGVDFTAPLLRESFDTTDTPAGWSVVNHGGSHVWAFNDPGARGNLTGGTGTFAIMDSDKAGSGKSQDTSLVTPVLDLSGTTLPILRFNQDYRAFSNSTADVDVSTDGVTWTNVLHQTTTAARGPRLEQLALPSLAGAATAQVRFRYKGSFAWWWGVDNVELVDRLCLPIAGGLLTGFVTDANTSAGLVGAKVGADDDPAVTATTVATPDPNQPDGYYWLFSAVTGERAFTAAKNPYNALTKTVTVVADTNKHVDFALKSPRLVVTPTSVQAFQPYGTVRKTTLTITNTGSATATVDVTERAGAFAILGRSGAQLRTVQLPGKASTAKDGVANGVSAAVNATAPQDTWTTIASYPDEVYDNAAAWLDGKVYSVGGGSGTGLEATAFVYDPATNAWTALPDMPRERSKAQAAVVGGKLYVFGGWAPDGPPHSAVDVFDPAAGTWSTVAGAVNPAGRAAAGVGVAGGKVYLVGGCADDTCATSDDTIVFDPATGTFSAAPAYPQTVAWMSCGGIGARIYCAGGSGDDDYRNGYAYDPAARTWTPIADMPLDLWGSAGSAAGGLLLLAGGVTAGSTSITNRSIAYDPVSDTWTDAPNAQFSRYRGAGACGAYKIGGSPSSFVGSADSEVLPGLEDCDEVADVPWLSETPAAFTLGAGKSRTVTVTLTATADAGVAQPGKYTAQIRFKLRSPYPVAPVGVEMNVSPPASWGKIQGTVEGLSCSGAHVGVKATVRLNLVGSPGVGYTLHADAQGKFAWWLPRGTYQVIVAKDGWVPQATNVIIEAGIVRTADFLLESDPPCPSGV